MIEPVKFISFQNPDCQNVGFWYLLPEVKKIFSSISTIKSVLFDILKKNTEI